MTCDHALELLLEADLGELDGHGDSPFAAHVRECAKCGAVAARVAMDTRALARAPGDLRTAARPAGVRRPYRLHPVALAGALAAAFALVLFGLRQIDDGQRVAAVSSPLPAPVSPLGTLVAARRFAEPAAATPMRLVASQPVAARATGDPDVVTVTAPEGIRVAVLRTGNPAITVVWLY
jgi:hypothetical protein